MTEWVAWFSNEGREPTPIIRDVLALDGKFQGSKPVLYSNNGDFYSETGYTPTVKSLDNGASVSFAPNGGRPSDGAFPYYRIMFDKWGLSLAIGWPAQWAIHFDGSAGRRSCAGGSAEDQPAVKARRTHPHTTHDRPDVVRRRVPSGEPVAPLVPCSHSAPAQRPTTETTAGCRRHG